LAFSRSSAAIFVACIAYPAISLKTTSVLASGLRASLSCQSSWTRSQIFQEEPIEKPAVWEDPVPPAAEEYVTSVVPEESSNRSPSPRQEEVLRDVAIVETWDMEEIEIGDEHKLPILQQMSINEMKPTAANHKKMVEQSEQSYKYADFNSTIENSSVRPTGCASCGACSRPCAIAPDNPTPYPGMSFDEI